MPSKKYKKYKKYFEWASFPESSIWSSLSWVAALLWTKLHIRIKSCQTQNLFVSAHF